MKNKNSILIIALIFYASLALSMDNKKNFISVLLSSIKRNSLEEEIKDIRTLSLVNKDFNEQINSNADKIIERLSDKYKKRDIFIAGCLSIPGSISWLKRKTPYELKNFFFYLIKIGNTDALNPLFLKSMKKLGISINSQDSLGYTPLIHATNYRNKKIMKRLLSFKNIEVNLKDKAQNTVVYSPVISDDKKTLKLLLSHPDFDPNIKDINGNTPLMLAIKHDSKETLKLLLNDQRIDINQKNLNDQTALDLAKNNSLIYQIISEKS